MLKIDHYARPGPLWLQADILAHYRGVNFRSGLKLQIYCIEIQTRFLDILKDRLYTTAAITIAALDHCCILLDGATVFAPAESHGTLASGRFSGNIHTGFQPPDGAAGQSGNAFANFAMR
jgi:hypothetical protein